MRQPDASLAPSVRRWPAVLVFVLLSVPLCVLWPRAGARLAHAFDDLVARALVTTSPDVVRRDQARSGAAITLGNEKRYRVAPMIGNATSLAFPIFLSLAGAAFATPGVRNRLVTRVGARALVLAAIAVVAVEVLAGWTAIAYALAVDNGRVPGGALRLSTVGLNAVRSFVPFVVIWVALLETSAVRRPRARARVPVESSP